MRTINAAHGHRALFLALLLSHGCGGPSSPTQSLEPLASPPRPSSSEIGWGAVHVPLRTVTELSLMSFNVRYGTSADGENHWDHRADLVVEVLRSFHPDVIALQEDALFQVEHVLDALPSYAAIGIGAYDGRAEGEHVSILYRTDRLHLSSRGVLWLSERPDQVGSRSWGSRHPRVAVWARLEDRHNGQPYLVYNTHLDHRSDDARGRALELLATHIEQYREQRPVIVMGDLNLEESNEPLLRFLSGTGLVDTYRLLHLGRSAEEGTYHGFRGDLAGPRVDFILVSSTATTRAAEIVRMQSPEGRYPSDHYPITATIRVSRTE